MVFMSYIYKKRNDLRLKNIPITASSIARDCNRVICSTIATMHTLENHGYLTSTLKGRIRDYNMTKKGEELGYHATIIEEFHDKFGEDDDEQ